jgi:hypothetical protein
MIENIFQTNSCARVLVLAYNRFAVAELQSRFRMRYSGSVPLVEDRNRLFSSTQNGCLVSTFRAFAFKSSGKTSQFKDKSHDNELEDNIRLLKEKTFHLPRSHMGLGDRG